MNRAFYWDELKRELDTNLLYEFGFKSGFEKLEEAYNNITGKKLGKTVEFETDPEVWSAILPQLVEEVETTLYQNIASDDITTLKKADKLFEEFKTLVDNLEYVFEEAVISRPRPELGYDYIFVDCDLFEALLNTDIEFRFINACDEENDRALIYLLLPPGNRADSFKIALRVFQKEVDDQLFRLREIQSLYKNIFPSYVHEGVWFNDELHITYKDVDFIIKALDGIEYRLQDEYGANILSIEIQDILTPTEFIATLDKVIEDQQYWDSFYEREL